MNRSRLLLLLTALAFAGIARTALVGPAAAQSAGCAVNPADLTIDAEEQSALEAINALRAESRLPLLSLSPTLGQAAAHKSATMASTGVFAHDDAGRSWMQRIRDCGYRASETVTENLGWGTETGRATVQMWRDSPGHLQNMLHPGVRAAGIARVRVAGGRWYWTGVFGGVLDAGAEPPSPPVSPPAPAPTGPAATLQTSALATVNAGRGDCLNIRAAPGRSAAILGCLPDGAVVRLAGGPQSADGSAWWQLEGLGWASGEFLSAGAPSGRAPITMLAGIIRLPSPQEDPCVPTGGNATCDPVRLSLWLGDYEAWSDWTGRSGLSHADVLLLALRFRADQGSARAAALLQALGR